MSEDGINSGARNVGRFFLFLIPYALGLGVAAWLGVYVGVHDFRHQLTQEERAAVYTGAKDRPTSKITVDMISRGCIHVIRADVDGSTLLLYARNDCDVLQHDYLDWHWQEISPNGTVLHEKEWNLCPTPINKGDIAECRFSGENYNELPEDDRTDKLRVWTDM